ncbi:CopD family protein [Anaerolinea sp.]|uniref:CopD family protein n=1 Tax=Anaerolinea sp. TaxID=1872519 RepID=UPI002ACDEB2B|nr:CopD family protein [Anaerolinea sp.]
MQASSLALALTYWLHMLATVLWLGSLSALAVLVLPAARLKLDASAYAALLEDLQERLQPLAWLSLAVLAATGMFQMSAHPRYSGFLAIENAWAVAILIKHLFVGGMVLLSAYNTWGLLPQLRRMAILRVSGKPLDDTQLAQIQRRERLLLTLLLISSVLVLAFTALARAMS